MTRISTAAAVFVLCSSHVLAEAPENGKRIAERWCASCHIVAPGQERANTDVPSFMSLGKAGSITAERLSFILLDPHPAMPRLSLSREEITDLAAYINSW